MEISERTAKILVSSAGAEPSVTIPDGQKIAVLHLTKNSAQVIGGGEVPDSKAASAINIKGSVDIVLTQPDWVTLENVHFHFIQVVRETTHRHTYIGATATDGWQTQDYALPPMMPPQISGKFLLDSGESKDEEGNLVDCMPFTNPRRFVPVMKDPRRNLFTAQIDMDDHPNSRLSLRMPNSKTGKLNYLSSVHIEFEAVTAFVHRDIDGKVKILGFVAWDILWLAEFKWRGGICSASMRAKTFNVEPVQMSKTNDPEIDGLVQHPPTDRRLTFNSISNSVLRRPLERGFSAANLGERSDWSDITVPSGFWT